MIRALFALLFLALTAGIAFLALTGGDSVAEDASIALDEQSVVDVAADDAGDRPDLAAPEAQIEVPERQRATSSASPVVAMSDVEPDDEDSVSASAKDALLKGRVTDASGFPLVGADVVATPTGLDRILDIDASGSAGDLWRRTKTNEQGLFELECGAGKTRLTVRLDGFAPFSQSHSAVAGAETDLGDLRLAQGVILRGRVVDESGVGIEGATFREQPKADGGITILRTNEPSIAVSGPGGEFEIASLAAGTYRFFVEHTEYPSEVLSGQLENPGDVASDVVVTLRAGAFLRGTVTGVPAGAGELSAYAAPAEGGSFVVMDAGEPSRYRTAPVAADGTFEINGLEDGVAYSAYVTESGGSRFRRRRRSLSVKGVAAVDGSAPVQLVYSEGASLSFTVVDVDGKPLVPDDIRAGFGYAYERDDAETDEATGRCTIPGLWPEEDNSALQLRVASRGLTEYSRDDIQVIPGDSLDLGSIVLEPRPVVRVTVVDADSGEPVKGAKVTMTRYSEPTNVRRISMSLSSGSQPSAVVEDGDLDTGTTDSEGICELDATAGMDVMLRVDDGMHAPQDVGPVTLPETALVHEQEVRLLPGGGLRITALRPDGSPASRYPIEFKGQSIEERMERGNLTGDAGVIEITGLAPGACFLRLGKRTQSQGFFMPRIRIDGMENEEDENDWLEIEVLAGEIRELTLEAPAIGSLTGTITERGEPLGGAKVELRSESGDNPLAGFVGLGGGGAPSATTDARGEFRIDDLEEGDYELVIEHKSRAMPAILAQEIDGGAQEVKVDLSVTEVAGTITNEKGEPVVGARVQVERAPEENGARTTMASVVMFTSDAGGEAGVMMSFGGEEVEAVYTDADGNYRLRGVRHGVPLIVAATADELGDSKSEPFTVAEGGEKRGVDLEFRSPGSIRVKVEGLQGRMLAVIRKAGALADGQPRSQLVTEAETLVDALAPGRWTVSLNTMGQTGVAIEPESITVEVTAGETVEAAFEVQ
ncbi:MAG: carboxypeptidase regulatory-like domain-containing protein [Planctomycetota bacterium]